MALLNFCRHEPRPPNEDQIVPSLDNVSDTRGITPALITHNQERPSVIQRHNSNSISEIERFLKNVDKEEHACALNESVGRC